MERSEDIQGLRLALGVYLAVFALKLGVYFATGVMALLAEAFHTLSDIFVSLFLLLATIWSRKKADRVHMFGYGRAQNVAALVAATLFISFTSYELYREAIPRLFKAEIPAYRNLWLAVAVIGVSMAAAAVPLLKLFGQKRRGPAAKAQLAELFNDELGLAAALAAALFLLWDKPIADPIGAVVVATLIAYSGVKLFKENLCFLIGRAPGPEFISKVEALARSVPGVRGVHDLRAELVGPESVHAGMHIEVDGSLSTEEAAQISEQVHQKVQAETACQYCVIHVDPA